MVRGKFQLSEITEHATTAGSKYLTFNAVSADGVPENERFHKYTPAGRITMTVTNPSVLDQFVLGEFYYVDFNPVPSPFKQTAVAE